MQILLLSNNDYLSGLFNGYCLNIGCEVNTTSNCKNFYATLHKKPPVLVFIDMTLIPQLLGMAEWQAAQHFIEANHIVLCGFGNQLFDNENKQPNVAFKKMFPAPLDEDEILFFMQEILINNKLLKTERRQGDRRYQADRRRSLPQQHTTSPSYEQQNLEEDINIGSLVINRAHKMITINNVPVNLSYKEFEIIDYLASNSGSVVATKDIIKMVWSECTRATKADVHQYVHMLRKKIEEDPHHPKLIVTVKGVGYELCP